jgi:hypothetical protein
MSTEGERGFKTRVTITAAEQQILDHYRGAHNQVGCDACRQNAVYRRMAQQEVKQAVEAALAKAMPDQ